MKEKINQNEINALIAKEIREKGLNEILKIDTIRERVYKKIKEMKQGETINELENPSPVGSGVAFPRDTGEQNLNAPIIAQSEDKGVGMPAGAQTMNTPIEPTVATKEIPDFLKNVEPGKIIVFGYNELSEGGENLTNKPFRTLENPENRKSIGQMWSEEGKTKAEVYLAKFEKVGNLEYDYQNGTTKFVEDMEQPLIDANGTYKPNPYKVEPNPVVEKNINDYVRQNVDIDKKVNDVITNIVKNYFLTNTERAVNDQPSPQSTDPNVLNPNGTMSAEAKKSMGIQENIGLHDLVAINSIFRKIDTPADLLETLNGKSNKASLVYENEEVKKFVIDEKEYYFPKNAISIRKCYVK
jgi:hypothetical protein